MRIRTFEYGPLLCAVLVMSCGTVATAPSPSASPTSASGRPVSTPSATPIDADRVDVVKTRVPADFHYVVLGSATEFRLVLLDLGAGVATDVATVHVAGTFHTDAQPYVAVSVSADGSVVLLALNVPDRDGAVFVVRPDAGQTTSI